MLKRLAIFAVYCLIAGHMSGQPNQAGENKDHPAKHVNKESVSASAENHDPKAEDAPYQSNQDSFNWHAAIERPEWWLVIFGFGTLLVVGWQTKILGKSVSAAQTTANAAEKSAKAGNDSAAAALKQANIAMEAERAWVVERVQFLDHIPHRTSSGGGLMTAKVTLKNIGQQPAFLKFIQLRFHASERLADTPELPHMQHFPEGFMLAPRERLYLRALLEEGSFDDDQVARIEGRTFTGPKMCLYIYGCVVYESMGIRGVNHFCYMWQNRMGFALEGDKPAFEKEGPTGYNQHT